MVLLYLYKSILLLDLVGDNISETYNILDTLLNKILNKRILTINFTITVTLVQIL